jgi:hypothetical protein
MGDINVIPRIEDIRVAPAKQTIKVFNLPRYEGPIPQRVGVRMVYSDSNSYDTGMLNTGGDQGIYNFRLPTKIKIGDHIRTTSWGSIGGNPNYAGSWMFRSWLDGFEQTALYVHTTNPIPAGQRMAFIQEVDILKQSISSAWVWHKMSVCKAAPTGVTQIGVISDGWYHTLAFYSNPAREIAGASLALTAKFSGGLEAMNVLSRGLMVEHLIAP